MASDVGDEFLHLHDRLLVEDGLTLGALEDGQQDTGHIFSLTGLKIYAFHWHPWGKVGERKPILHFFDIFVVTLITFLILSLGNLRRVLSEVGLGVKGKSVLETIGIGEGELVEVG